MFCQVVKPLLRAGITAAGEDVDLDDVEEIASPPQERPRVLDLTTSLRP
jgi:hypothetical protein